MKKRIFRMLCNDITGKIISVIFNNDVPNIRKGFRWYKTSPTHCNNTIRAMIFWGFYESAEARLIPENLNPDLPVIELGASLGIVSAAIVSKLKKEVNYTGIEANPFLIDNIRYNIKRHNPLRAVANTVIENKAIAYTREKFVEILLTKNNTQSRITYDTGPAAAVKVPVTTLEDFAGIPYTLVCDIEGMEIEIFKHDYHALRNCYELFIELHIAWYKGKRYEIKDLVNIIIDDLGFTLMKTDGNVYFFKKPNN